MTTKQYTNTPLGENFTPPENPTRVGYTFKGWTKDGGSTIYTADLLRTQTVSEINHKFLALWELEKMTWTVTFLGNGGKWGDKDSYFVEVPKTHLHIPDVLEPVREGYIFIGWDPANVGLTVESDMTFTAQWEEETIKSTYLVFWDSGDGYWDQTNPKGYKRTYVDMYKSLPNPSGSISGTLNWSRAEIDAAVRQLPAGSRNVYVCYDITTNDWSNITSSTVSFDYYDTWDKENVHKTVDLLTEGDIINLEMYVGDSGVTLNYDVTAPVDGGDIKFEMFISAEIPYYANQIKLTEVIEGTVPSAYSPNPIGNDGKRFAGWSPTIVAASGDAYYTAQYT